MWWRRRWWWVAGARSPLHAHEIDEIKQRVDQEHLTLVPLSLYFKDGRAKLELGLGRGRKHYDKRQMIAKRDSDRDAQRAMAAGRRRQHGTG